MYRAVGTGFRKRISVIAVLTILIVDLAVSTERSRTVPSFTIRCADGAKLFAICTDLGVGISVIAVLAIGLVDLTVAAK